VVHIKTEKIEHLIRLLGLYPPNGDVRKCVDCNVPDYFAMGHIAPETDYFYCRWCMDPSSSSSDSDDSE